MTLHIESRHDLSPNEVNAIEDRLIDHNGHATRRHDGQGLGFVIRDEAGAGVPRDTQFFAGVPPFARQPARPPACNPEPAGCRRRIPAPCVYRNPKLGRIGDGVRQGPAPFASPRTLVNGIVRAPRNRLARGKTELSVYRLDHLPIDLGIPDRQFYLEAGATPERALINALSDIGGRPGQTRHAFGAPRLPLWPNAQILPNDRFAQPDVPTRTRMTLAVESQYPSPT